MLSPQEIVMKVIWPLENFVLSRGISIHLLSKLHEGFDIVGDQSIYELVLFNLVQNSTKFNKPNLGHIVITLEIKPLKDDSDAQNEHKTYILQTQVIDIGNGIEKERHNLLFEPLNEIRQSVGAKRSNNANIGLGLSCSKALCKKMGGGI